MLSIVFHYPRSFACALATALLTSSPLLAQIDRSIGFQSAVANPNHLVRIPQDPAKPFPTRDISVAFLIKLDALPTTQNHVVVSHARNTTPLPWAIQIGNPTTNSSCSQPFVAGEVALIWEGDGFGDVRVASGLVLPLGTWRHVTVTRTVDTTSGLYTVKFYDNGVLVSTRTQFTCGNPPSPAQLPAASIVGDLAVGKTIVDATPSGALDAHVDELALWDRVLADTEVASLFDGAAARPLGSAICPGLTLESGLVGYWRFNEPATDQTVLDWSGNANHGYLGQVPGAESDEPTRAPSTAPLAYIRQIDAAAACAPGAPSGLTVTGTPGGVLNISLPSPGAFAMALGSCTAPWPVCPGAMFLPRLDVVVSATGPAALILPWSDLPLFAEIYIQAVGLEGGILTGVSETWLVRGL